MPSGVRFGAAQARMHALKGRLWTPFDGRLIVSAGVAPDGRPLSGRPADVFPGLARWYAVLLAAYPSGAELLHALFRRHEIENLKMLWRATARGRPPLRDCWRPLEPVGVLSFPVEPLTPTELVHRLEGTVYAAIARALLRSHAEDLAATEIGLDRWVWTSLLHEADRLPRREAAASKLVRRLCLEFDAEVLRRGVSLGLEPDLAAKSTVVLAHECRMTAVAAAAAWQPGDGPLSRVLPPALARTAGAASDWDEVVRALRSSRLKECRRAFVGWPFQIAPAVAALLLREEQARAEMSIAAVRRSPRAGSAGLALSLAASALEG